MSETISTRPYTLSARPSWKALTTALRGDALGAFPSEAFEQEVVVHRLLGRSQFIINRPEAIRHILVENAGNYARPAPTIRVLRPLFGSGLFLSAGEEWKQQRRTVAPAFAPRAVRILARHVATAAHSLVTDLKASNNRPIQLVPVLQRLTLEVIGSAMFSLEMNRYGSELCHLILSYASSLGRPTLLDLVLPLRIPTPYDLGRRRFRRRWIELIRRIVAERRQQSCGGSHRDLFDLLMAADTDRGTLDAERLADQVGTIVVAGHETTAAALFWSLYLLASVPNEQETLAAEAGSLDLGAEAAAGTASQLVRTRAVVDEVLRLYPPAFVIVRQAVEDDLADDIPIPARSHVLIAPWVLHRHRRLWSAPETFDPSRFLPGAPPPSRFSYIPFGVGPRTCIGAQFAVTELVLILAALVRSFRIELGERRTVRPIGMVSTRPENPPPFLLRLRNDKAALFSL